MDELLSRGLRAYYTKAAREGHSANHPSMDASGYEEVDDKDYVVLRNAHGVLAVYRVRHDGMLKRLRRWPAELEEQGGEE
jgi:hypothetical protein